MDNLLIRPAIKNDIDNVIELLRQLIFYTHSDNMINIKSIKKLFSFMDKNENQYRNIVACIDDLVVGFLSMVYYKSFYHVGGTALINELIVSEYYRKKGIGRALIQYAINLSKRDGMDEIEVGTEKDNTSAIEFYRSVGFDEEYVLLGKDYKK